MTFYREGHGNMKVIIATGILQFSLLTWLQECLASIRDTRCSDVDVDAIYV